MLCDLVLFEVVDGTVLSLEDNTDRLFSLARNLLFPFKGFFKDVL